MFCMTPILHLVGDAVTLGRARVRGLRIELRSASADARTECWRRCILTKGSMCAAYVRLCGSDEEVVQGVKLVEE